MYVLNFLNISLRYVVFLSGLPQDSWELSQMLGRGGRDGNNAAFVIMLWTGQAGS